VTKTPSAEAESIQRSLLCLRDSFDQAVVIGLPVDKRKLPLFASMDPTASLDDQIALVQVVLTTLEDMKEDEDG